MTNVVGGCRDFENDAIISGIIVGDVKIRASFKSFSSKKHVGVSKNSGTPESSICS